MYIILLLAGLTAAEPPFLFPHGYFDSNKIKPFDAIYLNLMAASNLEYGGTTVEELDELDASRKQIPRPENLERNREEDDSTLDREVSTGGHDDQTEDDDATIIKHTGLKPDGDPAIIKNSGIKNPFSRVKLRNLRDDPMDDENPFEEIATRAPPRSRLEFQQLRRQLRKEKKAKKSKPTRPTRQQKKQKSKVTDRVVTTTVPPTLIPSIQPKIKRLPNNPYGALDISQPNIVPLPIPPDFV